MAEVSNSTLFRNTTGIPPKDACLVLIKTAWNAAITDELEAGCRRVLEAQGVKEIITLTVPGAVEIPFAIRLAAKHLKGKSRPSAFIALGAVIRGGTPHFDYVCKAVTDGITQLNLQLTVPVIFGVLTTDNEEQARDRTGGKHGHKGEEAALTALHMIALQQQLEKQNRRKKI